MKKFRIILFFISYLISSCLYSQSFKITNNQVYLYNHYINKAELLICDSLFLDALKTYDTAFSYLQEPFAIDKYNAAMCAFMSDDYPRAVTYLQEIVKRGYDYTNLNNNGIIKLKDVRLSKLYRDLKNTSVEINQEVKKKYDSIYCIDQEYRFDSLYWLKNRDTLDKINYSGGLYMSHLINLYGFPTEKLLGISSDLKSGMPWEIILIHNQVRPGAIKRVDFSQIIMDAVEKGEIKTSKAAEYIGKSIGKDLFGVPAIGLVRATFNENPELVKCGFINLSEETENKINTKRKNFGLDTVEQVRKKIKFNLGHPDFILADGLKCTFSYSEKSNYDNFINNLSLIK